MAFIFSLTYTINSSGQSRLYFSLEPNVMLANRKIMAIDESRNYLTSKNAVGTGFNVGFRKDLGGSFYATAAISVLNLRNSVHIDLVKSGFYTAASEYDKQQSYSMSYINALGGSLAAGYAFKVAPGKTIEASLGLHLYDAKIKAGGGALVPSNKYMGFGSAIPIYKEQLRERTTEAIWGLDLSVNYTLSHKRRSCMVGLHYAMNPGTYIRGDYITFPNFIVSHSGSFELSTHYLGLTLGLGINVGKPQPAARLPETGP